jgi:hypothetical protein
MQHGKINTPGRMTSFLTHLFIAILAGFGLFHLWRRTRSTDRWMNLVIAAGFLGRAIVGQVLFWISYQRFPIAPQLQLGDGLWFFARDALNYFPTAVGLAHTGVSAIIAYPSGGASVAFVKVLSTAVLLLGPVTSVAVLLNLFCYLGTMAVIIHWSEKEPQARPAAAFAIYAITLSPAFFLWSLQPLKDTFFQFAVIAFIGACAAWQRTWTASTSTPGIRAVSLTAGTMLVTLLAISGVRWYFAFALFTATVIFLLLIASMSHVRKAVVFTASIVLAMLLSRAFLLGGGPYVPTTIIRALSPATAVHEVSQLPTTIFTSIEAARDGFDQAGGGTSIHLGGSLSKLDHALAKKAVAVPAQRAANNAAPRSPARPIHKKRTETAAEAPSGDPASPSAAEPTRSMASAEAVAHTSTVSPAVVDSSVANAPPPTSQTPQEAASDPAPSAQNVDDQVGAEHRQAVRAGDDPKPSEKTTSRAKAERHSARPTQSVRRVTAAAEPLRTSVPVPAPPAVVSVSSPVPSPPARPDRPASIVTRLLTGGASVVIPRTIGERLGLFHIGGGQGMFWFVELDTLIFDLALLWAIVMLAARRSLSWRNPLVWFVALLTILAGVPLAYAITNYGTLFRLRGMIYIGLILTPLALATSWRRTPPALSALS